MSPKSIGGLCPKMRGRGVPHPKRPYRSLAVCKSAQRPPWAHGHTNITRHALALAKNFGRAFSCCGLMKFQFVTDSLKPDANKPGQKKET